MSEVQINEWLNKVARVKNESDGRGGLKTKAVEFLKFEDVEKRRENIDYINRHLSPDNVAKKDITAEGRQNLIRMRTAIQRELEDTAPPDDLPGDVKDALHKRQREIEEIVAPGMLTEETMRRNPVGAVDQNTRWHNATKWLRLELRNIITVLNPFNTEQDFRSVERLRKSQYRQGDPSAFMGNAEPWAPGMPVVTGHMSYAHIPDENWEKAGLKRHPEGSPIAQAEKREMDERLAALQAERDEFKAKLERLQHLEAKQIKKDALKENRRQQMEKAREAKKAKREAAAQQQNAGA